MKTSSVPVLLIVIMFCLAGPAQPSAPKTLDRTDAAATAQAILKAYAAKDLPAMAELSTADNREITAGAGRRSAPGMANWEKSLLRAHRNRREGAPPWLDVAGSASE